MLLGAGALTLPSIPLIGKSKNKIKRVVLSEDEKEALEAFYRINYLKAESIYKDIVSKNPQNISKYDNLSRVYRAQYKYLEIIDLYKNGLEKNLNNSLFYQRIGHALIRVSLGDTKIEQQYISNSGDGFPIQTACTFYFKAIEIDPDKKHLREGLLDCIKALDKKNKQLVRKEQTTLSFDKTTQETIESYTQAYKGMWIKSRQSVKDTKVYSPETLFKKLETIENKERRRLYGDSEYQGRYININRNKKKYYSQLLTFSISANEIINVEKYLSKIQECDKTDTQARSKVIKYYKRTKSYDYLLKLYESELDLNYPWTKVCIAQTKLLKGNPNYKEISNLFQSVSKDDALDSSKLYAAISHGLGQCDLEQKQYVSGRAKLIDGMTELVAGGLVYSLILTYAQSYLYENNYTETISIIQALIGSNTNKLKDQDIKQVIDKILEYNKLKAEMNESADRYKKNVKRNTLRSQVILDDLKGLYALAKVYEKMNNQSGLSDVLQQIKNIDPNDKFLSNRL